MKRVEVDVAALVRQRICSRANGSPHVSASNTLSAFGFDELDFEELYHELSDAIAEKIGMGEEEVLDLYPAEEGRAAPERRFAETVCGNATVGDLIGRVSEALATQRFDGVRVEIRNSLDEPAPPPSPIVIDGGNRKTRSKKWGKR